MGENFDSQSVGIRIQKKLLGKMTSRKIAQSLIDERSAQLLDNLYRIAKVYSDKKTAEKVIKHLIKTVIKIAILKRNDVFNDEEVALTEEFLKQFRTVAMTFISFYQVEFTYDRNYLHSSIDQCCQLLQQLVRRHLTDKSLARISNVFQFFGNVDFLDAIFAPTGNYKEMLGTVVEELNDLLENNVL